MFTGVHSTNVQIRSARPGAFDDVRVELVTVFQARPCHGQLAFSIDGETLFQQFASFEIV